MKKILFAVMAVFAIGFTSCGNKTQAPADEVDSAAIIDSLAEEAANLSISALSEQIEAGDASKLQAVLETVKVKVTELIKTNPEIAKEYVAKVQNFLKENADKVKALVGDNAAVAAAVSAITDIEPENVVNGFLQSVGDAAEAAKDSVVGAVENAKDAAVDAAKEAVGNAVEGAKEKANEAVDAAADKTKEALGL